MRIDDLLQQLNARLPELEWKTRVLGEFIPQQSLPRGLFNYAFYYRSSHCIAEIKEDIKCLAIQTNQQSACFLAKKIHQKINVLAGLCFEKSKNKRAVKEQSGFGMKMITTRQAWIAELEKEIAKGIEQYKSLKTSLKQAQQSAKLEKVLILKRESGELEKKITLAKEALEKAVS